MDTTVISLALFILTVTLWVLWRKRKLSLFKRYNIPGPEPNLFFGNYWTILHKGHHSCIEQWIKEYGRVFGYFYGMRPVLIVADLEMLRIIQVKEFQKFSNRPLLFNLEKTRSFETAITTAKSAKWKYMRSIITPTFTTSKLKMMNPITMNAVNELSDAVEKESSNGKPFDIYTLYQYLTMDVIARSALGIHTNVQTTKSDSFIKIVRILLSVNMNFLLMLAFSFPEIQALFTTINKTLLASRNKGKNPRDEIEEKTAAAIAFRRKDPNARRKDLLQLLMDAQRTEENVSDSSLTAVENDNQDSTAPSEKGVTKNGRKLSDEEVLQNSIVFLIAGYETTSTALGFVTNILAHNQDIQDKMREEIRNNIVDSNKVTYDDIQKLPYMEKVINETLRLHPPITYFVMREAIEDTVVGDIKIPKGIAIQIPIYYLHRDPTIWENPEEFDPERFSPEAKASRHPMAFQPFGAGPRNCVGMRFALTEMKTALAKLLSNYKFLPTEKKFEIDHSIVIDRPKNGVYIKAVKIEG